MDNRYIGVFDSGLGGLTAVKELMTLLPNENIVYFGDTGRVPYGTKSNETILKYVQSDIRFLQTFDLKLIVAACGTASAIALPVLQNSYDIPVMGVLQAAANAALEATKNKKIGIIGTQSTINSDAYHKFIAQKDSSVFTISRACPLFVPLVENGYTDNEVARLVAVDYLKPIRKEGVDTLILGCTHYPLLKKTIQEVMGDKVALIDPGEQAAHYVKRYLEEKRHLSGEKQAEQYQFFASDSVESFADLGSLFLERAIDGKVAKIEIEKYV